MVSLAQLEKSRMCKKVDIIDDCYLSHMEL